jgi:hypothetical protein
MTKDLSPRARWIVVMVFGLAMAWLESACVIYLRTLVDRVQPYQANPLPVNALLSDVELWREAATLVMIAAVGCLAGRTNRQRVAYAAIVFGTWDLFYYVFLYVIAGWPRSLFDWDILFLLPLPWWGPVLAPASIALLMIVWGTFTTQSSRGDQRVGWAWAPASVGIALGLAVFMTDAWHALPGGRDAVLQVLPTRFNWPLFWVAFALMAAPVGYLVTGLGASRTRARASSAAVLPS